MRYYIYLVMLFSTVFIGTTGCEKNAKHSVKIFINFPKAAGDTVIVGRTNMISLASIELAKVRLDSTGKGVVEVAVKEPFFAFINNGKNIAAGILILPGQNFQIRSDEAGTKLSLRFEGDGAAVNQVYYEMQQVSSVFNKWNGSYSFRLEANEFLKAKDSLQRSYDQLLGKLKTDPEISAEKLDLLKRHADMHVIFYQYNFAAGKDFAEIPLSVREVVENFPVDTIALKVGVFDYGLIGGFFYNNQISNAIYEENEKVGADTLDAIFPALVENKIKASHYPKSVEDFLRVKSASVQIALNGLTPDLRMLAKTLEQQVPSKEYKSVLREDVDRWEKIGPGKPAPNFSGITPDGKQLALSDLRGKVVYVDIWATWCGPCISAFPDSKKVQAAFKGNDRIAFLYVSVDRDTLAWKKMVVGGKVPDGIHILSGTDKPESVWNLYHVWGIPRYLLIDERGRMVATHAAHPSTGNAQEKLRKVLAASSFAQK
ncbi:TlpA disulfide reductase family protein [Dyadobacter sp. LHD-138]|uniref:TlpA family protein disulfide reductase n=1 Tax=Dyadobacter sp. LHD-138 TaxID=3071413 RepID=UPI0027E13468|nr:TlpA disulfide reductase family protein [Dyadobacter sp. LHD-138]MDQ6479550.1 TlpA disulfide reductase family protein [Dyadobacter sp. LHD-138]